MRGREGGTEGRREGRREREGERERERESARCPEGALQGVRAACALAPLALVRRLRPRSLPRFPTLRAI